MTPLPVTIQNITQQLALESKFNIGARVYFQDVTRASNWYKGRITDINFLDEEDTFNVKDEFGIVSQNLQITNLRDPSSQKKRCEVCPKTQIAHFTLLSRMLS